jgi:hypothetical protein
MELRGQRVKRCHPSAARLPSRWPGIRRPPSSERRDHQGRVAQRRRQRRIGGPLRQRCAFCARRPRATHYQDGAAGRLPVCGGGERRIASGRRGRDLGRRVARFRAEHGGARRGCSRVRSSRAKPLSCDLIRASRARHLGRNDVDALRQEAMSRHPIGRLGVPRYIVKGIRGRGSGVFATRTRPTPMRPLPSRSRPIARATTQARRSGPLSWSVDLSRRAAMRPIALGRPKSSADRRSERIRTPYCCPSPLPSALALVLSDGRRRAVS